MQNNKTLTPTERALLQFVESMFISTLIAVLTSVGPILTQTGPIDWKTIGFVFGLTFLFSLAHGAVAYLKPTQPDLAAVIAPIVDALEARILSTAQPPLQGSPTQAIQGPLVVVHSSAPVSNAPETPATALAVSTLVNTPVSTPTPKDELITSAETTFDTVKLPAVHSLP